MIGMYQATKAMHMDASISVPVEAFRPEIFVPSRAEKMGFRYLHACILCHQAIGVFDSSYVSCVLGRRKLDHPVRKAGLQFLLAVNDLFLVGAHLRHDLGPSTRRGAI